MLVLAALALGAARLGAQPQGTAFTYQGRLSDAGAPAAGAFDFRFALYDAPAGGSQVGPVVDRDDVVVAAGLFTLSLDFGASAFTGAQRFLAVSVRPGAGTGAYAPIGARQEITPAPSALFGATAPWSGVTGKPSGFADDDDDDTLAGLACTSGQVPKWGGASWLCSADEGTAYGAGAGLMLVSNVFSLATAGVSQIHLADNAVVASKLANGAVTGPKLADGAVDTAKLADLAVTSSKIQIGAVTGAQIATATIPLGDIGQNGCALDEVIKFNGAVWGCGADANTTYTPGAGLGLAGTTFSVADDGVTTPKLANGAVTTAKLAGSAVTSAQIVDGTIALADLGANGCLASQVMKWNGTAWACATDVDSGGDITSVTAGAGLTGGATTGAASLAVSFAGSGAASTVARSDHDHASTYAALAHNHFGQTWSGTGTTGLGIVNSLLTGLTAETASQVSAASGVYGIASNDQGIVNGVRGRTTSTEGRGVLGEATATGGARTPACSAGPLRVSAMASWASRRPRTAWARACAARPTATGTVCTAAPTRPADRPRA